MLVTNLITGRLRTTFHQMKSKYYTKIDKGSTKTSVSDTCQHRFREKASTQQSIPLKFYVFHFNKNGETRPNESGRAG